MLYKRFNNSSQIFSASYIEIDNTLKIKFHKGYTYEYYNVPEEAFIELCNADSVGSYFNKNIARKFKFKKV